MAVGGVLRLLGARLLGSALGSSPTGAAGEAELNKLGLEGEQLGLFQQAKQAGLDQAAAAATLQGNPELLFGSQLDWSGMGDDPNTELSDATKKQEMKDTDDDLKAGTITAADAALADAKSMKDYKDRKRNAKLAKSSALGKFGSEIERANLLSTLGKGLGGALSVLGSAGGTGIYANKPGVIGQVVSELITSGSGESKKAAYNKYEAQQQLALEGELKRIDALPPGGSGPGEIEEKDRELLKLKTKSQFHDDMRRAQRMIEGSIASDKGVKNVKPHGRMIAMMLREPDIELSDEDWKTFEQVDPKELAHGILSLGEPFNDNELQFLHTQAKENTGNDFTYDIEDCGIWSPETLRGYRMWIKNSNYTYKPEARQVDPSIDPNEKHIGPMAQEIEKVNPACIIETPEGVKTVDTNRLSLMNTGVIADLARQNLELGKELMALKAKVGV
jgi:hypothetical protein